MGLFAHYIWTATLPKLLAVSAVFFSLFAWLHPLDPASASALTMARPAAQVADVSYVLDPADPARLSAVELRLGAGTRLGPAPLVKVQLDEQGTPYPCAPSGQLWRCPLPSVTIQAADALHVVITP